MTGFIRTARADEDLIELWLYIAADNRQAADALLDWIDAACERLAQNPALGPARPDLGITESPPSARSGNKVECHRNRR